jgi:hypothetical protein
MEQAPDHPALLDSGGPWLHLRMEQETPVSSSKEAASESCLGRRTILSTRTGENHESHRSGKSIPPHQVAQEFLPIPIIDLEPGQLEPVRFR